MDIILRAYLEEDEPGTQPDRPFGRPLPNRRGAGNTPPPVDHGPPTECISFGGISIRIEAGANTVLVGFEEISFQLDGSAEDARGLADALLFAVTSRTGL